MRYLEIADHLRSRIAAGETGPGGALPSESELGREFEASRVTVRRALDELRHEGLVTSRRGSGWFVALDPVRQSLGRFSTVEAAMEAAGHSWRREVVDFRFEAPPPWVADALATPAGSSVLRVERVNYCDEMPFGLVTVWVPEEHGAAISRREAEDATFYELLTRSGVTLGSATQTITALAATDAHSLLGCLRGVPILQCRRLTRDVDGVPVLFSEHQYLAHRTSFEVELPRVVPAGEGPVGLRVLEEQAGAEAS